MSVPSGKHNDLPWPLSLLPRNFNAIPSNDPPHVVAHSAGALKDGHNADVPAPGNFTFSVSKYGFNFAWTTKGGTIFRIGTFRYDYVDHYYTLPTIALHKGASK